MDTAPFDRAASIKLPLENILPGNRFREIALKAKATRAAVGLIFTTLLASVAAAMGPFARVKPRRKATYAMPVSTFFVCSGEPGSGKSASFRAGIQEPMDAFESRRGYSIRLQVREKF